MVQVFNSYEEFNDRKDKTICGISVEFSVKYPDYLINNKTNIGCWNCVGCYRCVNCFECVSCIDCKDMLKSTSSTDCYGCVELTYSKSCSNQIGVMYGDNIKKINSIPLIPTYKFIK